MTERTVHIDERGGSQRAGRRDVFAGAIVFVVAAIVRLAMLHTARFGGDEALFFGIGMDIVEAKSFPLLGTQITDGAARLPGPAFLYVMALPLLVWRAPEAQYAFVEVLGAVTVVVFWQSLRRIFGERAAFCAGLVTACAPWSALYADRTWNPNVLPLVVTLAFLAVLRLRENPTSRWGIALFPLLAVMPQFHMAAPVAWAGLLVLLGKSALRLPKRSVLIGLALALLLYLPLLGHELSTGFSNTQNIFAETVGQKGGERHPWGFVWVPVYVFRFLTFDVSYHELTGYWGGPDEWKGLRALVDGSAPRPFHPLRFAALAVSIVVALVGLFRLFRNSVPSLSPRFFSPSLSLSASASASLSLSPSASASASLFPSAFASASPSPSVTSEISAAPAFAAALVVATLANTALMGVAAKQVFGHYVTCVFVFVAVAWACFFKGTKRNTVAAIVVAILCTGGIEATWSVSQNVDGKIGLEVHRKATAVIVDDATAAGLPQTEPVSLTFRKVRSSLYDWHIFATRAANVPLHFDNRAPRRRYALTPLGTPAPKDAVGDAIDVGHALLWRVR